jgi:hypothetical protein
LQVDQGFFGFVFVTEPLFNGRHQLPGRAGRVVVRQAKFESFSHGRQTLGELSRPYQAETPQQIRQRAVGTELMRALDVRSGLTGLAALYLSHRERSEGDWALWESFRYTFESSLCFKPVSAPDGFNGWLEVCIKEQW